MLNAKNLSILMVLALATAAAGTATADRRRDAGWIRLGDVGTHVHDAEDYVSIDPGTRRHAIQLRARGGWVALDGVRIQYASGRSEFTPLNQRLRPGEAVTIDLSGSREGVATLVLDYGNRGPYWRARETAHVAILGLQDTGRDDRARRDRVRTYDRRSPTGVVLRGGIQVRIR